MYRVSKRNSISARCLFREQYLPPSYSPEERTKDGLRNYEPQLEEESVEELRNIAADVFVKDGVLYDIYHDHSSRRNVGK